MNSIGKADNLPIYSEKDMTVRPGYGEKGAPFASAGEAKTPGRQDNTNERADVARRILELSDTIAGALEHMSAEVARGGGGAVAASLKDIGEGLISLENASKSIAAPAGADPGDIEQLGYGYEDLCEKLDAFVDACLDGREEDYPAQCGMLRDSFAEYAACLARCYRALSII